MPSFALASGDKAMDQADCLTYLESLGETFVIQTITANKKFYTVYDGTTFADCISRKVMRSI